jgi:hypothetical protein
MGRPVGSKNRELPFNSALRLALRGDPLRLRRIAEKLAEKAEEGDLAAIRELADRLDGKPAQAQVHSDADGGPIQVVIRQLIDITGEIREEPVLIEHEALTDCAARPRAPDSR